MVSERGGSKTKEKEVIRLVKETWEQEGGSGKEVEEVEGRVDETKG